MKKHLAIALLLAAGAARADVDVLKKTFGSTFLSVGASAAPSSKLSLFRDDSDGKLKIKNVDGTFIQLAPDISMKMALSSLPNATWKWTAGGGDMFHFEPNDGLGVDWHIGVASNPNAVGVRNDNVMTLGWNCGSTGVIDPSKGHLCLNFEDHYYDPNHVRNQSEWYVGAGGPYQSFRPIAINTPELPAWAAQTHYTTSDFITNDGATWVCITEGDSAASGGPTGTGSDVTDGTAHWKYLNGTGNSEVLLTGGIVQAGAGAGPSGGQVQLDIEPDSVTLYGPDNSHKRTFSVSDPQIRALSIEGGDFRLFDYTNLGANATIGFNGNMLPLSDGSQHIGGAGTRFGESFFSSITVRGTLAERPPCPGGASELQWFGVRANGADPSILYVCMVDGPIGGSASWVEVARGNP